jgi:predicted RNA-binding protein with PIN domain
MCMVDHKRLWIVDGHNLIFQLSPLEELQTSGRRGDARRELEDHLRRFAHRTAELVVVVYDGNEHHANPDTVQEDLFHTTYSSGDAGELADDRIVYLAGHHAAQGTRVTVVTSDVATLGRHLPDPVDRMDGPEFWRKHIERPARLRGKRVEGDFSDVEAEFLRRDGEAAEERARAAPPSGRAASPAPSSRAPSATAGKVSAVEASRAEQQRRKKQRGLRRQQRRLKGYKR